jgi:hypothetical protein
LFDQTLNRLALDHLLEHRTERLSVQTYRRPCEAENTGVRVSFDHTAPLLRGRMMGLVDDDARDSLREVSSNERIEARELN